MAASLTIVAIQARKTIRYGILLLVFILIGRALLIFGINTYRALAPTPPPPPTVNFGVLSQIPFPNRNLEFPELQITADTPTGVLPSFPEQMNVYYMPVKTATLFSFDRMNARASGFGFTGSPRQEQDSETLYSYVHPNNPSTLQTDIVFETFSLSYNLAADPNLLTRRAPDVQTATTLVKGRLQQAQILPEDMDGPVVHEFLRVEGQNLVRALSLSDAQLTKISLYRRALTESEYPSVTANPKEGNIWFLVSGSTEQGKQIIAGEYKYFAIDETRVETYPIKTAAQALEDLRAGKGFIANLGLNTGGNVTIREMYLAYYDPNVPYIFYQPVVVFRGDGEFVAYVPAVTDEYYGE